MPKATKKKKDKAADFSKAKLKLGKGKQLPTNAVDTSFKARSIALPTQSITKDKDAAAPSTRRKLTFDDLVTQLKHYSPGTRKDALAGLKELLTAHPELLEPRLTALVTACSRLIGDEEGSVRKALLAFLSWLLLHAGLSPEALAPHAPALLLFTTSAQTHIFPEIRVDAVRVLDVLLQALPASVVAGWDDVKGKGKAVDGATHGWRVLEGYLGILSAGTKFGEGGDAAPVRATSTASVVLSAASKLIVMKSLATFLQIAICPPSAPSAGDPGSSTIPTWYLASAFASSSAFETFDALLKPTLTSSGATAPRSYVWKPEADPEFDEDFVGGFPLAVTSIDSHWGLSDLHDVDILADASVAVDGGASSSRLAYIQHLASLLHPLLVSTFLDCAPAVFSPSQPPSETELGLVAVVVNITQSLYGRLMRTSSQDSSIGPSVSGQLSTLLGYMAPYFPFTPSGNRRDMKIEQTFQDISLVYCELTSLMIIAGPIDAKPRRLSGKTKGARANAQPATNQVVLMQIEAVAAYIIQLLQGANSAVSRPPTLAAYTMFLPTVWCLLNTSDAGASSGAADDVMSACIEHAIRTSSTSAVKGATVDFMARLVLMTTERQYTGGLNLLGHERAKEWILHLPKTLWELAGTNRPLTEVVLRFFLRLHQRRAASDETTAALCSRFAPYFSINHPTKGKVLGPYSKLQSSVLQRLVLDTVATMTAHREAEGLLSAVRLAVAGTGEELYWQRAAELYSTR